MNPTLGLVLIHRREPEILRRALRALYHLTATPSTLTVLDLTSYSQHSKIEILKSSCLAENSLRVKYLCSFYPNVNLIQPQEPRVVYSEKQKNNFPLSLTLESLIGSETTEFIAVMETEDLPVAYGWDLAFLSNLNAIPEIPNSQGIRFSKSSDLKLLVSDLASKSPPTLPNGITSFLADIDAKLDQVILARAHLPGQPLEDVACDHCGNRDSETVLHANDLLNRLPGFWTVVECKNCGLVYTNPRPRAGEILNYYPDSYGCYLAPAKVDPKEKAGFKTFLKKFKRTYRFQLLRQHFNYFATAYPSSYLWKILTWPMRGEERMKLVPVFPTGNSAAKLLEIGCGVGGYILTMQGLGWKVVGVEPSSVASEIARGNGLDVRTFDIESLEFKPNEFDAIVMNMVLEHLPSPKQALNRIFGWLKPGGELLFAVPDFSGFEARTFGPYHYGLQVPTHLYHFTPASLKNLLPEFRLEMYHQHFHRDLKTGLEFWMEDHPNTPWRHALKLPRKFFSFAAFLLSLFGKTSRVSVRAIKPLTLH